MRILIADDSIVSRHLLEATLRKWDYDVVVACDGTQAWSILEAAEAPRLAILDWMMPGLTGIEICRLVRQQGRETYTYILLLTSKNGREDLIAGMDAGADDYLTKPFDHSELQVRLRAGRRILDLHAQLLEAREALREQATRDSLTRLWNRSSILEILQRELTRGERENTPVGIVILDLDHFKSINDTYGHISGDAVLREAGRRLQSTIRPYDAIGRYGGEEFLVVLPGCDENCAANQAERMRQALLVDRMKLGATRVTITGSFGATCALPQQHLSMETLIHRADDAMYEAKRTGRNRVVLSQANAPILIEPTQV